MIQNRIVQKYDFLVEVLPVLVIGVLLDLLGRYAAANVVTEYFSYLELRFFGTSHGFLTSAASEIFLDMTGTAYAAVMAGPWWAAIVGVTSNAINGGFYDAYFPFAVVNVMGGLAWGYLASGWGIRARVAEGKSGFFELLKIYLGMWLVGAVVAGLGSSITRLILFTPMHHPLTAGWMYDMLRKAPIFQAAHANLAVLFVGDFLRDLIDKSISVLVALIFVFLTPAIAIGMQKLPRAWRLRTDMVSVFSFSIVYGLYMFAARANKPTIKLFPTDIAVNWLHDPYVIFLLYVPVALAMAAFLLFTYDNENRYGRLVEGWRLDRKRLYRNLTSAGPLEGMHKKAAHMKVTAAYSSGKQIYGVAASVVLWPARNMIDVAIHNGVYFSGALVALAAYLIHRKKFVGQFYKMREHLTTLHDWMNLRSDQTSAKFLSLIVELIGARGKSDALRRSGPLLYQLVYVPMIANNEVGRGRQSSSLAAATGGKAILIAVVVGTRVVDENVRGEMDKLISAMSPDAIYLVSVTEGNWDGNFIEWLRVQQSRQIEIGLLRWRDLENMIDDARATDTANILINARLCVLNLISEGDPMLMSSKESNKMSNKQDLSLKALPSLAHVIDHLPPRSTVFDLGAGFGRHTLYCLKAGHFVTAVERRPETFATLQTNVSALGKRGERGTLILGDIDTLDPVQNGYADLIILTGVLQHCRSHDELASRLGNVSRLTSGPGAVIYVEMLFDMLFDGKPPVDGRMSISREDFERKLQEAFPPGNWSIERVCGPTFRRQDFTVGVLSFIPACSHMELTTADYVIGAVDQR